LWTSFIFSILKFASPSKTAGLRLLFLRFAPSFTQAKFPKDATLGALTVVLVPGSFGFGGSYEQLGEIVTDCSHSAD
jgi:hypothetical protein